MASNKRLRNAQPGIDPKLDAALLNYIGQGGQNMSLAARRAGYSEKEAASFSAEWLKDPAVKARLKELADKVLAEVYDNNKEKAIADLDEILTTMTKILRDETDEETAFVCIRGGDSYIEKERVKTKIKQRIEAANILLKAQGYYDNTLSVRIDTPVIVGAEKFSRPEDDAEYIPINQSKDVHSESGGGK